jgi:putative ABC transport system permease protein
MFKNYIKTAWRNLWKGRVFNSMNIVGLAVAIASSTLLLLTVFFESSYDGFHKNIDNIYQVYFTVSRPGAPQKSGSMPVPLTPTLKADYPDIKYATRLEGGPPATITYGDKQIQQELSFVDPDYFKMFSFPIIEGNKTALSGINDVVLTQSSAKAIFGNVDPIGKTIAVKYDEQPRNFIVSGIMADPVANSSLGTDLTVRFENSSEYKDLLKVWDSRTHISYIQLNANADPAKFENGLKPFVKKYLKGDLDALKRDGAKPLANGEREMMNIYPFKDNHFNTEMGAVYGSPVSKTYIGALLVIAIFIMIIACINFVNLSVARSFTRAREIGVRKTLGAGKWQLLTQFWTETVMVCLIALIGGLSLAALILPGFKAAFQSSIKLSMLLQPAQLFTIIGLFLFITVVAGFYPALLMLRYKTTQVLKGSVNTAKPGKVRNILLVVQFSLATILTICTLITWQQIGYLQTKPLGYNKNEVISIPIGNSINGNQALQLFRNQMAGQPGIEGISGAYTNLGRGKDGSATNSVRGFNYKGHEIRTHEQTVDYDYLKTLDIKLVAGRDFSRDYAADSNNVVINEKMAAQVGRGNVVGMYLPMRDNEPAMQIVGVFKDYNFKSLHEEVEPLTLTMKKDFPISYIFVRVKSNNLLQDFNRVKEKWHAAFPNIEFTGSWLTENTEKQYRSEKRLSTIFISAAIIAIIISCIGLLAISIMVIVQRTKEIGIRKVLGSSVSSIVILLSREFANLVIIASIIAFPVAWWVMHKWLEGFAYRIAIQWWVFALSALIALVIALLTISVQAVRAALANPVKSLKSE